MSEWANIGLIFTSCMGAMLLLGGCAQSRPDYFIGFSASGDAIPIYDDDGEIISHYEGPILFSADQIVTEPTVRIDLGVCEPKTSFCHRGWMDPQDLQFCPKDFSLGGLPSMLYSRGYYMISLEGRDSWMYLEGITDGNGSFSHVYTCDEGDPLPRNSEDFSWCGCGF